MRHFYRKHHRWLRWLPRKKHLHGGWLHRRLGERLFHPDLWAPTRRGLSLGLALGTFIALTPTMGAQFILAAVVAYLLRVNLPIALAACLITNPLSAPFVYGAQYQLGIWLVGLAPPSELEGYAGVMRSVMRHGKPMWVGSLVAGSIGALLSIVVVNALWPKYEALQQIRATHRAVKKARAAERSETAQRQDEIVPEPD